MSARFLMSPNQPIMSERPPIARQHAVAVFDFLLYAFLETIFGNDVKCLFISVNFLFRQPSSSDGFTVNVLNNSKRQKMWHQQ